MPQTGKLDKKITLQSYGKTNNSGQLEIVYADAAEVWAEIISRRGNEAFESARTNAHRIIRVRIRYRADVTLKWRIVWEGQTYNITDLDPTQRRSGALWMTCEAVGAL